MSAINLYVAVDWQGDKEIERARGEEGRGEEGDDDCRERRGTRGENARKAGEGEKSGVATDGEGRTRGEEREEKGEREIHKRDRYPRFY